MRDEYAIPYSGVEEYLAQEALHSLCPVVYIG